MIFVVELSKVNLKEQLMHILIVEDELRLADTLRELFVSQKHSVDAVFDGADGLYYAERGDYDVIVLDLMLPKMSGFEVLSELRRKKISTPVLVLTARDGVDDKVKGLDLGADDYLTKPFSADELFARVRALSRRKGEVVLSELSFGDIVLSLSAYSLTCGTKSVHLGGKEFEMMRVLMLNRGLILSKETLINKIWGGDSDVMDNNVEAYVSFLRKKLGFLGSCVQICSARKQGYYLSEGGDGRDNEA